MSEGWNISIECKAKGREYGMTFEGSAYHIDDDFVSRFYKMRYAVGDSIQEMLYYMFEKYDKDSEFQKQKEQEAEQLRKTIFEE